MWSVENINENRVGAINALNIFHEHDLSPNTLHRLFTALTDDCAEKV